jgi:two-component system nitrate/nitrite response regulator NarL
MSPTTYERNSNALNIAVLVADSCMFAGELLAGALRRAGFEVTGCVTTAEELLCRVRERVPDVALVSVDLRGARLGGFKALRELSISHSSVLVIMLADETDREMVVSAFRGGAKGVFVRAGSLSALFKCIRAVRAGQVWASSRDLQFILEALSLAAPLRCGGRADRALTKREEDIVALVAKGYTNQEIARKLYLSEHTVKNHLFRIFDKLNVSSRVEVALYSIVA